MTPLRQRLVDDLRLRNYSPRTIEIYMAHLARFAKHFGKSPDLLGADEMRAFQLHLIEANVSWSLFNQAVCALRFFYGTTLGRKELVPMLPFARRPRKLPCVLSPEEVAQLLEAARPGRERTLLTTTYACGLRLQDVLNLEVKDIDSARMVVHKGAGRARRTLSGLRPRAHRLQLVSQPPLSEVPGPGPRPLAGARGQVVVAGGVPSCGLHLAGGSGRAGFEQSRRVLQRVIRGGVGDLARGSGQPEAARRSARRLDGAAHVGPESASSSAR